MPISNALKNLYSSAPNDIYEIETLQISHPQFVQGPRYICNQRDGFSAQDENSNPVFYEASAFSVLKPKGQIGGKIELQVTLDNTTRETMEDLERLSKSPTEPIEVIYRVYLSNDPNTVQNLPPLKLDILGVVATVRYISFVAGLPNFRFNPFPKYRYELEKFPGLVR